MPQGRAYSELPAGVKSLDESAMLQPSTKARFLAKVKEMPSGCHEWAASKNNDGYGNFGIDGTNWLAHRAAWFLWNGPIPDGLYVLHSCDNPSCVRLDHLWLGTQRDNIRDMVAKGRQHTPSAYRRPAADPDGHRVCGERNGMVTLSDGEVRRLRADYAAIKRHASGRAVNGELTSLAKKYGVGVACAARIGTGQSRKEATAADSA